MKDESICIYMCVYIYIYSFIGHIVGSPYLGKLPGSLETSARDMLSLASRPCSRVCLVGWWVIVILPLMRIGILILAKKQ